MKLAGNGLEEQAAKYLADLLLVHTGLKSLDLSYNQLNDQAGNTWPGLPWNMKGQPPLVAGVGSRRSTLSIR